MLFSHALNSVMLPAPSHSTVLFAAWAVMVGAVVSSIVKVADVVLVLPAASVAVKTT